MIYYAIIEMNVLNGAHRFKTCKELGINERTFYCWIKLNKITGFYEDLRPSAKRPEPVNKLSQKERQRIIDIVNQPEFTSIPPCMRFIYQLKKSKRNTQK